MAQYFGMDFDTMAVNLGASKGQGRRLKSSESVQYYDPTLAASSFDTEVSVPKVANENLFFFADQDYFQTNRYEYLAS